MWLRTVPQNWIDTQEKRIQELERVLQREVLPDIESLKESQIKIERRQDQTDLEVERLKIQGQRDYTTKILFILLSILILYLILF